MLTEKDAYHLLSQLILHGYGTLTIHVDKHRVNLIQPQFAIRNDIEAQRISCKMPDLMKGTA